MSFSSSLSLLSERRKVSIPPAFAMTSGTERLRQRFEMQEKTGGSDGRKVRKREDREERQGDEPRETVAEEKKEGKERLKVEKDEERRR